MILRMPIAIDSPQRLEANLPFAMRAAVVAILIGLAPIGCRDGPTSPNGASVRVVQGGVGTDTILALPPTPLVVEVRSPLGRPLNGVSVRFVVEPMSLADSGPRRRVYVCSLTQT